MWRRVPGVIAGSTIFPCRWVIEASLADAPFLRVIRLISSANRPRHTSRRRKAMDELKLREMIAQVKAGRMSRRNFIHTMAGLGLAAPLAAQMLAYSGVATAQPA